MAEALCCVWGCPGPAWLPCGRAENYRATVIGMSWRRAAADRFPADHGVVYREVLGVLSHCAAYASSDTPMNGAQTGDGVSRPRIGVDRTCDLCVKVLLVTFR